MTILWVRDLGVRGTPATELFVNGTQGAPRKMTFLSGLDLAPRRAAPLAHPIPWVASAGPKNHTGIGVGPGPAGVSLGYIRGGSWHLIRPTREPRSAARADPYGLDRLDLSFPSVPGSGRVGQPSREGGRFCGFQHVS